MACPPPERSRPPRQAPRPPWQPTQLHVNGVYRRERKTGPRVEGSANQRKVAVRWDVRFRVDAYEFRYGFDKKAWAVEFTDRLHQGFVKGWLFDPAARRFVPPEEPAQANPTFVEHAGDHYRRKWPTWSPMRRRDAQWALALACVHLLDRQAPPLTDEQRLDAERYIRHAVVAPKPPEALTEADRQWEAWFARWSLPLRAVDDSHLHAFLETVRTTALDGTQRTLAPSSIGNIRTTVRSAFKAAYKRRLIEWDPWDAVEWSAPRDIEQVDADMVMDPAQVMAMAEACGARHRGYEGFVLVQGFCGLRPSEARELRRRDFDLDARPATVTACGNYTDVSDRYLDDGESRQRPLKGRGAKARRMVPIPDLLVPRFRAHLDELVPGRPDALVFTTPTGIRIHLSNFHRAVWGPAREALFDEDSPLRRVRRHDLRHAAITAWLNSGVLPKTAQKWSGHRRLSVLLDTYVGVMREDAATSLARVEEALHRALDMTGS